MAAEYVTIDLGSAQAATAAIVFAHTILVGDSLIQVRKSTDNFAANDVLVGSFTWTSAAMVMTFSSASSRYWRIAFTKASAGVSRDIGRIFIGNYVTLAGLPDFDGFEVDIDDMSQSEVSEGGQTYSARRSQRRMLKLDMSGVSQAQAALLKTFYETVGTHTCYFLIADENAPSDQSGETLYVKTSSLPKQKANGLDTSGNLAWSGQLSANEQL